MVLDAVAPAAERLARARARLAKADAILADLDGTLIFGSAPAPGATELLARFEGRSAVVSNYSTVTGIEMSNRLLRMGLSMPPEHIFLAGEVALRELARSHRGSRLLCVMAAPMRQLARDLGLELVEQNPDLVLVGRDLDFTYPRLVAAMQAVHAGARIYATNPDLSHPTEGGWPVPETGSLLAAVLAAAPRTEVVIFGKPEPLLFEAGLHAIRAMPPGAVMLGDNPDTDVRGAAALASPPSRSMRPVWRTPPPSPQSRLESDARMRIEERVVHLGSRVSSLRSRGILRAGVLGKHLALSEQAWQFRLLAR